MALEVDGAAWRVVPDDVVVKAGLVPGLALDRPVLRRLRRELRRADALGKAGRVLARRDVSESALRTRLARSGVASADAEQAVEVLRGVGALDDARYARDRARMLCERGWGDEAIAGRLEDEGAPQDAAREAVAGLAPEAERARELVTGVPLRKAAALLARRGFAADSIEAALPGLDVETGAELA